MKVLMIPSFPTRPGTDGISRVVEAYQRYLPEYGVEFVHEGEEYDIKAVHAGVELGAVCHLHGLYWSGDYDAAEWEWESNRQIVNALRQAKQVTVPSAWVAETLQRDMRLNPTVVPHGIEWQEWQHNQPNGGYVLYNKNRQGDICDATPVAVLANRFPGVKFISTFAPANRPGNVTVTGRVPFPQMKQMVQRAGVYLATAKETWGIGLLESLASGVPVLAFNHGGAQQLVQHGVSGYLAKPGDWDDLSAGLAYCLEHRDVLGANGRELAKAWTWRAACEIVAGVYRAALVEEPPTVGVVIPFYNKTEAQLRRAIESAINQSYKPTVIVVVDDGSKDERLALSVVETYQGAGSPIKFKRQPNSGVAIARNRGIELAGNVKYFACLDADDWLAPDFLKACVEALEADRSLGIAYTGLTAHSPDGQEKLSEWPPQWNFDKQLQRQNQVPTACVFRRDMFERLGGYRVRYCPTGAGSEDANLWTRSGAFGWKARKVTEARLFHYQLGGQVSSNKDYHEVDWLSWFPWVKDGLHPFASYATPANKRRSHPVRQYDEPAVSVIIPVGPGHEGLVVDALDSLEAQTFRKWEAIVVWDSEKGVEIIGGTKTKVNIGISNEMAGLIKAYPYVRWVPTSGKRGAGYSRNLGASYARAPFLVFLDADDWLHPTCLQRFLETWGECQAIVYSDYVGKAIVTDVGKLAPDLRERIYSRDEKTGEALLGYHASEYDCARAMRPLDDVTRPYYWCNVTALIPKAWHDKAGGFDEALPTWEDVEYHWRLARLGYPYQRIPEELMLYRLNTGTRRDESGDRQTRRNVIEYIKKKLEGYEPMPCPGGCGGRKVVSRPVAQAIPQSMSQAAALRPSADPLSIFNRPAQDGGPVTFKTWEGHDITVGNDDLVLARLVDGNKGSHRIIGPVMHISYGHHSTGQEFLVHRRDLNRFLEEVPPAPVDYSPPPTESAPLPPPVALQSTPPALTPVPQPDKPVPLPPAPLPVFDLSGMNMGQINKAAKGMSRQEAALALEMEKEGKNRPGVVKALTKAAGK